MTYPLKCPRGHATPVTFRVEGDQPVLRKGVWLDCYCRRCGKKFTWPRGEGPLPEDATKSVE